MVIYNKKYCYIASTVKSDPIININIIDYTVHEFETFFSEQTGHIPSKPNSCTLNPVVSFVFLGWVIFLRYSSLNILSQNIDRSCSIEHNIGMDDRKILFDGLLERSSRPLPVCKK